ncbi:ABC transporter permease, partial [Mycobacterium sp. ITM-2017-0098]
MASADATSAPATTPAERVRLFIQPVLVLIVGAAV